jgi:excisionase family DNA binding protein
MNENIIRVSVSEAAKLFGVSTKTIREAIKAQELRYIVVNERYKINFESLVQWSQKNKRRAAKLERQGIGQFVNQWQLTAPKYSPRPPTQKADDKRDATIQSAPDPLPHSGQ